MIAEEATVTEGRDPGEVARLLQTRSGQAGPGSSDHWVRERTAPFTPASCSSPGETRPSFGRRIHRKQEVSPVPMPMAPGCCSGGLGWIWGRGTYSHRPGGSGPSAAGASAHGTYCRLPVGAQGLEVKMAYFIHFQTRTIYRTQTERKKK